MFAVVHTRASIGVSAPSVTVEVHLSGGLPALSMPSGFINGLPAGTQVIGNYFQEGRILNVAHRYQMATDWHQQAPGGFA